MASRYIVSKVPLHTRLAANEKLLAEIDAYCAHVGISVSSFGTQAVNDGKLVPRLRSGGRVTAGTVKRIRDYLAQRPPIFSKINK